MALSRMSRIACVGLAAATLAGVATDAFASHSRYYRGYGHHARGYYHGGYYHGGNRTGALVAGTALGLIGGAIAGAAADNYYNGYPSYTYGPGYGGYYGYDYHPGYGYYGPY